MAKKNFEEALTQLEQIVEDLEKNDFSIDQALKKFEEGMELVKICQKTLEETQSRINALNQGDLKDDSNHDN